MRKQFWAGVIVGLVSLSTGGCGSSSDSNKNAGSTDPASLDFCLHWANDVCSKAYQCTDASAQDAAFHTRYGKTQDDCWQSIEPLCVSNQSGGQAFGPSCGPGKQVNDTAASACTDGVETETCADWTAAPAGTCDAVCGAAVGNTGGGNGAGGNGAGGNGAGGAPATGSLPTATDFCTAFESTLCDRTFECDAAEAAAVFGTVDACKSTIPAECAGNPCPGGYDATSAASCVAVAKSGPCSQFMSDPPASCAAACMQ